MNSRHLLAIALILLGAAIASLAAVGASDEPIWRTRRRARRQARRSTDTTPMCEVEDQFGSIAEIGHCRCGGEENKKTASCKTRHIPELRVERGRFYSIQFCQDHSFIDSRLSPANFSSFPPIKVLDLTGCGVRSIAPLTFERLQSLQELNLGRNNLSDVPPNAFSKVSIDRLNLAGNPGLRLTPETFVGADVRSLNLENCALGAAQVNHRSLQPLIERGGGAQLRTLYVGGNRLQTLDPALRPWVRSALRNVRRAGELQTHVLGLADNPLRCSCSLLWLADLARDYPEHFKQLSRVTCTLQTSVWPPSNVDAVPPSASALNRTVLLSELSQYAATLGCAPPSLSSLNMVLSESAAWEFKLRVEANPMPDYVLVARKSTLTLASEAGPNDEDAMIRTLLSLDPQQVVRATAASHVFDPVRNTFYADLSVRVEAGNTSDVGDYVLLARNHLGKLVFRLETKLARYFQLQQLVQQTTPAAVTANFTNLSVLCETVLAGRLMPRLTTAMTPVKAGHADQQMDAQRSSFTSSKLFSWFEMLIAVLLTAIISSAVTFLVASLFMAERPFRLCFCLPFCRRRAQNKQSLRPPLNGSNSIFLMHNPVVSYSHVPSNATPSRQAGAGVGAGAGTNRQVNASRQALDSSAHAAEGEAVALVGALNGSAQLSDSPRSAMETSVNMPLYSVNSNPNAAGSLTSVASADRKQSAHPYPAATASSGALLLQPSVASADNSVLLTQLIGALCNQLAATQNTPSLSMPTNTSEQLRQNATHYPTATMYAPVQQEQQQQPPATTLSPQQLLTLMQQVAMLQNANQQQGAASLGSGVGSAHMNPALLSATAQQWARAALANGGNVPFDPAVGTMGRSRAPSVAGSNPYMTLPHSTNTLSNGNRISQTDSVPPLQFMPPDYFPQRQMMNAAAINNSAQSPARQPVNGNGASHTLGAQSMRLPPFRPIPLNNASAGGFQSVANPFSAIGAHTARPHRSSTLVVTDSGGLAAQHELQLPVPAAGAVGSGIGVPQRAVRSTSAMFPLVELKGSASGTGGTGTSGGTCGEGDYMCASLLEPPDSATAECDERLESIGLILPPPPTTESPGPQPPPPSRPKLATPSQTPGQSRRT